jgi:hypothetical protein
MDALSMLEQKLVHLSKFKQVFALAMIAKSNHTRLSVKGSKLEMAFSSGTE